jgi:organic radical activating enzyme
LVRNSLAPAELILRGIDVAARGLRITIDRFLDERFGDYCRDFNVPGQVATILSEAMRSRPIEVNLSGGNPELHQDLLQVLAALDRREDIITNLTTTGRRVMREPAFAEQLMRHPPDVIAFSADDFSDVDQIHDLAARSPGRLRALWNEIPAGHGQRQKAIEAICAARVLSEAGAPGISFNLVIHPGNLDQVERIVEALRESFPESSVFPYPAQTAFLREPGPALDPSGMERLIDQIISAHTRDSLAIVPRLHYWLALKAVYRVNDPEMGSIAHRIGGYQFWNCQAPALRNRYLQVGGTTASQNPKIGGGYLGCNWNREAAQRSSVQVWDMTEQDVAEALYAPAHATPPENPNSCPGCAFPRLLFDMVNTELGLNQELVPAYLELRKLCAGY